MANQRINQDHTVDSANLAAAADSGSAATPRSHRGFAAMDQQRQREIASRGGRVAHARGTAHQFDSAEARAAGRKGGESVSRNREHMAQIGRLGGQSRGTTQRAAAPPARPTLTSTPRAPSQSVDVRDDTGTPPGTDMSQRH